MINGGQAGSLRLSRRAALRESTVPSMPEASPSPAHEAPPVVGGFEPLTLSWRILSSPLTFAVLATLLALNLLLAMTVRQGATLKTLLADHDFSTVQAVQGLGLDHVSTAWSTQLLWLLLLLNVIGLFLRHRAGADQPLPSGAAGVWVSRVHGVIPSSLKALASQVEAAAGGGTLSWSRAGSRLVLRRGRAREAIGVVGLGLLTLLASLVVQDQLGLDAQMTVIPGGSGGEARMQVREEARWVERQQPLALTCDRADPADPQRRRLCQARSADWAGSFQVGAGSDDWVAGYRMRALEETPRPGRADEDIVLLMTRPGAPRPSQLQGRSGQGYRLSTGEALSLFAGPHGPLVVVSEPDEPPYLMAPALGRSPSAAPGTMRLEASPSWSVVMAMTGEPGVYLWWAGLLLLLVGLLLLCRPHVTLHLEATIDGTAVVVESMNRSQLPAAILEAMHRSSRGER